MQFRRQKFNKKYLKGRKLRQQSKLKIGKSHEMQKKIQEIKIVRMLAEEDTQQRSNTWRSGLASSLTLKIENSLREKEKIFKDTVTENFC